MVGNNSPHCILGGKLRPAVDDSKLLLMMMMIVKGCLVVTFLKKLCLSIFHTLSFPTKTLGARTPFMFVQEFDNPKVNKIKENKTYIHKV